MRHYEIAVIGIGRVGLPLSLSLCDVGFKVIGIDKDKALIKKVQQKIMPFDEPGYEDLLKTSTFEMTDDSQRIKEADTVIITVGTPLRNHIETDLSQITEVIQTLCPHFSTGQTLILRSTIAPGTTEYIKRLLEKETPYRVGKDLFLCFCPERLAEGKAMQELKSLPQVIGSEDAQSAQNAAAIFSKMTKDILHTDYRSAELVKLFNNTSRYIHFAMANEFAMIADQFDTDIYEILKMTNYNYPRGVIPSPGFTAGTCLRKDFGMINENSPYSDLLLSAWKVNEFTPKFLIDGLLKRTALLGKKVAVLGYTFKMDTDDARDSLIPKLLRYIQRQVPKEIKIHDPYLEKIIEDQYPNESLDDAIKAADIVFIGTNHSVFKNQFQELYQKIKPEAWLVDIWNISGKGKIFYQKKKEEK